MNLPQIDYYSCYYYNCLGNQILLILPIKTDAKVGKMILTFKKRYTHIWDRNQMRASKNEKAISLSWARVDNRSVRHNCQQPSQVLPRWYTVDIGCSGWQWSVASSGRHRPVPVPSPSCRRQTTQLLFYHWQYSVAHRNTRHQKRWLIHGSVVRYIHRRQLIGQRSKIFSETSHIIFRFISYSSPILLMLISVLSIK